MFSDKELKALQRQIDTEGERIEDLLAPLKAEWTKIDEQIKPLEEQQRAVSDKMDAVKSTLHIMRLKMRDMVNKAESAKEVAK